MYIYIHLSFINLTLDFRFWSWVMSLGHSSIIIIIMFTVYSACAPCGLWAFVPQVLSCLLFKFFRCWVALALAPPPKKKQKMKLKYIYIYILYIYILLVISIKFSIRPNHKSCPKIKVLKMPPKKYFHYPAFASEAHAKKKTGQMHQNQKKNYGYGWFVICGPKSDFWAKKDTLTKIFLLEIFN